MLRATSTSLVQRVVFGQDTRAFAHLNVKQLLRTMAVFRICGVRPIVKNTHLLLKISERILGAHFTYDVLVKSTFFEQFCAGVDEKSIVPSLRKLVVRGVGPILDFAAEAPVDSSQDAREKTASALEVDLPKLLNRADIIYEADTLDANVEQFLLCIDGSNENRPPSGVAYAAVKITGLCDPQLLARVTAIMLRIRQVWAESFIPECNGNSPTLQDCRNVCGRATLMYGAKTPRRCPRAAFRAGLLKLDRELTEPEIDKIISFFDPHDRGYVHYFEYIDQMVKTILDHSHTPDQLRPFLRHIPRLTQVESGLYVSFQKRMDKVVQKSAKLQVRLMVDAEQTYYQLAIDSMVLRLMRDHNKTFPTVYNTYQAYLKYTEGRMHSDIAFAKRHGFIFAAKIVRGAYLEGERKDADRMNYECPIHSSIRDTHNMYDSMGRRLLAEIENGNKISVLFGTHNVNSLQLLTDRVVDMGLRKPELAEVDVSFAQLYGMGDHLTIPLAMAGFKAYKYVPYGPVKECIFYLHRRALENSEMLKQTSGEWPLLKNELKRKLFRMR